MNIRKSKLTSSLAVLFAGAIALGAYAQDSAKPVLDPGKFFGKAKAGYEAAKSAPEICGKLFCYCGCDLTDEHTTLLDCFTSDHGVDCFICQEEALVAAKLKQQGKSVADVQKTVDLAYSHEYPWDEQSPAFKKYIADKPWKSQVEAEIARARSQDGASSASGKVGAGASTAGNAKSKAASNVNGAKGDAAKRSTKGSCCGGKAHAK